MWKLTMPSLYRYDGKSFHDENSKAISFCHIGSHNGNYRPPIQLCVHVHR